MASDRRNTTERRPFATFGIRNDAKRRPFVATDRRNGAKRRLFAAAGIRNGAKRLPFAATGIRNGTKRRPFAATGIRNGIKRRPFAASDRSFFTTDRRYAAILRRFGATMVIFDHMPTPVPAKARLRRRSSTSFERLRTPAHGFGRPGLPVMRLEILLGQPKFLSHSLRAVLHDSHAFAPRPLQPPPILRLVHDATGKCSQSHNNKLGD